jgi:hypothetical protein
MEPRCSPPVSFNQFALIVRLWYERRARRRAELQNRQQLARTAHLEVQLAMGELNGVDRA